MGNENIVETSLIYNHKDIFIILAMFMILSMWSPSTLLNYMFYLKVAYSAKLNNICLT